MAELTTAAQAGGTAYTLTVGDVSKNFAGIAKVAGAPEIDKVTCIDTNTIEVVFKKAMDRASVEDVANYTLNNNATVKAAELWIDQDDSRKTVKLTTENVVNNKVYKLKVANVKSADMVAIKTVEKSFAGVTDTKAPTIDGNVKVKNNQRLWVYFDDKHGVDKATAEDIANWEIEGLTITKVTALDDDSDDYGYYEVVEVDTEPMTPSKKYTLTINNLADGSSSKNVIAKALTKTFYGVAVDKTAPKAGTIDVLGDNMVEIVFTDTNRLDAATATDINNYTFNEGLQVISASLVRPAKPDTPYGKTVVLTTSTMDTDTTYKITIENVADEFGNVMTKVSNRALARSKGADIKAPAVKKVEWVDKNTIKVHFDERLDVDSANDPANYSINNDIGVVKKAEVSGSSGYTRVDLTTPDLTNNKAYKLTINGVKDRLGNEVNAYVVGFTAGMKDADTDRPEIDNIIAANEDEIRITFDEAVVAPAPLAGDELTYTYGGSTYTADIVGLAAAGYTIDDNTTVVFKTDSKITTNEEITIEALEGIFDKHNNAYVVDPDDKPTFYGNTDDNDAPEVVAIDQVSVYKLEVTFSEPVIAPATLVSDGITFDLYVDKEDDQTTEALSLVTMIARTKIAYDKDFDFDFSGVTDYVGEPSEDDSYDYTAYLDDDDNPVIDYVEAVNTQKIQVHFNESMDVPGSYIVKDSDGKTVSLPMAAAVDDDDDTIVNLTFTNTASSWKLKPGDVYTLIPKTAARDIAGNAVENITDLEFDFVASAVVNYNYIKGFKITDAKTLEVEFTTAFVPGGANTLTVVKKGTDVDLVKAGGLTNVNTANTKVKVELATPLLADVDYVLEADGAVEDKYEFEGKLADGGLTVTVVDNGATPPETTAEYVTFSGYDNSFVVKVVYLGVPSGVAIPFVADNGFNIYDALEGFSIPKDTTVNYYYTVEVYRTAGEAVLYSKEFAR